MIIFIHIQKTSGTVINTILKSQRRNFWYKYHKMNNKYPDIISGHIPYGIHKDIFPKFHGRCSYFTFLRNPIERWKSQFYHAWEASYDNTVKYLYKKKCNKNIIDFLNLCLEKEVNCNLMVKQLSGIESLSNINRWKSGPDAAKDFNYAQVYGWAARYFRYTDDTMRDFLTSAIYNLSCKFDFFGYKENSTADYNKLCKFYKWKPINFAKKYGTVTRKKFQIPWRDKKVSEMLQEINKYDIMLYQESLSMKKNK